MFWRNKTQTVVPNEDPVKPVEEEKLDSNESQTEPQKPEVEVEPEPTPKKYARIEFTLRTTYDTMQWYCNKEHDDVQMHFKDFVKWYHCRTDSDTFVFKSVEGVTCVRRVDILLYKMYKVKETEYEYMLRNNRIQETKSV